MRKQLEEKVDPRYNSYVSDITRLDNEIKRQRESLAQTNTGIADLERRLNQVPGAEVGLEAINREYQSAKATYETMLAQQQKAELGPTSSPTRRARPSPSSTRPPCPSGPSRPSARS